MKKIVFMGTPDFAVPCLEALILEKYDVAGVFTQPDKPKGRTLKLLPTPVKEFALSYNLPVFQPKSLKDGEALAILKDLMPDIIVVVAYGKILPEEILSLPKYGCVNIHASLLPKYRGAGPIQWSIINGEKVTGITSMLMQRGLDTGPMILKKETEISSDETAEELTGRLSRLGAEVLKDTLKALFTGEAIYTAQKDDDSSYAPMITKELSRIDFNRPAAEIHNLVRGLQPQPGVRVTLGGQEVKIHKTRLTNIKTDKQAGEILGFDRENGLIVACGDFAIGILTMQAAGGKRMSAEDYLRGRPLKY